MHAILITKAQGRGVGSALFDAARTRAAAAGVLTIDAWTRDDESRPVHPA